MEGRTHRPVHDEALCAACSICADLCPAVSFPEYRRAEGTVRRAVFRSAARAAVRDAVRPCRAACPLHQDVPAYARAVARGNAAAALAVIRETNPLPAVCGTVCNRSCERACVRARVDQGVAIRALKRFAVDEVRRQRPESCGGRRSSVPGAPTVGVVGAGPAGLAAAHDLAAAGVDVLVYDDLPRPGGMLAAAVPSFVLPRAALAADVDLLLEVGAKFRTGVRVGRDVTVASLRRMHRAVLIATGAPRGRLLGVPGEAGLDGVCDHVTFARRAASESLGRGEGPAVVVGGSNAAFQCARIAVRLGCEPVTVAYHRAAGRLPADEDQIDDAREEGVRVECLVRPVEVLGRNGRVDAVRFERVREAEPDAWGWRALEADRGELALPAATLVPAVDREADLDWLDGLPEVGRTPLGFLAVDPATAMTAAPGLFAAGDVVGGPKGVVEAVAAGRKAAAAIRRWLEADG